MERPSALLGESSDDLLSIKSDSYAYAYEHDQDQNVVVGDVVTTNQAYVWPNNVGTLLPTLDKAKAHARALSLVGSDIYVGGYLRTLNGPITNSTRESNQASYPESTFEAGYWKKGVWNPLACPPVNGVSKKEGIVYGIKVAHNFPSR
ncbi:MAG: hypothetical protein H7249_13970 [Chitinophagaceae bacterium]|nr:hypothetical protein [Oligoflexus sp.]